MKGRAKGLNRRRGLVKAYGSLGKLNLLECGPQNLIDNLRAAGEEAANNDAHEEPAGGSLEEKSSSDQDPG